MANVDNSRRNLMRKTKCSELEKRGDREKKKNEGDDDITEQKTSPIESRRRGVLRALAVVTAAAAAATATGAATANAVDIPLLSSSSSSSPRGPLVYKPAKRATCYLVDSTIPPTLVPLRATREAAVLKQLGTGRGTPKSPFIEEGVNLNNVLNKGVFGAIDLLRTAFGTGRTGREKRGGGGYASFVFLGMNDRCRSPRDVALAVDLLADMLEPRRRRREQQPTALALSYAPLSTQGALDSYSRTGDEPSLRSSLRDAGVDESVIQQQLPLLRFARTRSLSLLAVSPEYDDIEMARRNGLQSIPLERRMKYVVDSGGFINTTQDPKFRLYAEKSLLGDFSPRNAKTGDAAETTATTTAGDFFAERILVHETAATILAEWAMDRPDSLVVAVAPAEDVRFLGGMNGRVPRVCGFVSGGGSIVDDDAVTTILLNPTAENTLSKSRFLRLEIGTAPENKDYQTKVADYLWFSSMPKVNMLPRMMNPL